MRFLLMLLFRCNALLSGGIYKHNLVVRRNLAQHNMACLLSRAGALASVGLRSLARAQGRGIWLSAGERFKLADPGGN